MLAAPKRPESMRVVAGGVRRLAEQSFPADAAVTPGTTTRALPELTKNRGLSARFFHNRR